MPRSTVPTTNFTAGMFDPKLYGRSDIEQYRNGAKDLVNCIIEWYGGATRTPGTYYVAEVKDSADDTRLVPFVFSNVETYILEFGDLYIRFFKDNGAINSGATPYEVTTTYTEDEVFDIQYVQTADVLYLFHPDHAPAQLIRTTDTSWALSDVTFVWGPWQDLNTTATTMDAGATTGNTTLTASAAFFNYTSGSPQTTGGHVGAKFKMHSGYMTVVSMDSATVANVTVNDDLTAHTATATWYESAFSPYRGYPACCAFYEDRLVMAATATQPNTVWLSEPGAYEQFEGGSDADDAITETINARRLNIFKWIDSSDVIILGNEGGLVKYWSGSESAPLTPTNKNAKKIVDEGVTGVLPVSIGSEPYYVGRDGKIIRTLQYTLQSDNYLGADVTLLSRSLMSSAVVEMAHQQAPHGIIWYVLSDGTLISSTVNVGQKITAYTQQSDTGSYKSVASIPVTGYDEVWFIVEREVNGSTVKYIEYMKPYDETTQEDLFFVRSGITYDSTSTTTITGLTHLEGESVEILADGFVQPNKTVASGSITLDRAASTVQVGLGYDTTIETLNLDAGAAIGSALVKHRFIKKAHVQLHNTGAGVKIGTSSQMDTVQFSQPASLYTGFKSVSFPQGWKTEKTVRITQTNPLPLTVNGIYPDMDTND